MGRNEKLRVGGGEGRGMMGRIAMALGWGRDGLIECLDAFTNFTSVMFLVPA